MFRALRWLAASLLVLLALGFIYQLTTTTRDLATQPPPETWSTSAAIVFISGAPAAAIPL